MPFEATWVGLDIIILNEVNQERQISCNISSMWNLKKRDTSEPIYKAETDP